MKRRDYFKDIWDVKIVPITRMPNRKNGKTCEIDVWGAYDIVAKNYSDQPAKGNAKEFYSYWCPDQPKYHDPRALVPLDGYSKEHQEASKIVMDWFISQGIDMAKDTVYVLWDW